VDFIGEKFLCNLGNAKPRQPSSSPNPAIKNEGIIAPNQ